MIRTSKQLKDLIRNLSKEKSADAQLLMRNYMMERLLERISLSVYKNQFILKGGMLVSSIVGLDARSTMDMDATVKGLQVNSDNVTEMIKEIIQVPLDDQVVFQLGRVSEIMGESEYSGVRINMVALFDGSRTPLKVDISTGDVITPNEIHYTYEMMFEKRKIEILAYNLETLFAEKLETVIARDVTNTRMRDFYDIHTLLLLHRQDLDVINFRSALVNTARSRGTYSLLLEADEIWDDLENSASLQKLWSLYQSKFHFAASITWS